MSALVSAALFGLSSLFGLAVAADAHAAARVPVVAAENFYGDVATQIGGDHVAVKSIMSNPDQDPHLFETSPSTARDLSSARIVLFNGAAYDPWMQKLLSASPRPGRVLIEAGALVGAKDGDNPHLWYHPATMPAVAKAYADALKQADPSSGADVDARLTAFLASLAPINAKIASMRAKYAGIPITATEPVFGYMADAIGLDVRNRRLQTAVMNDTEPTASDLAAFEQDLRNRRVEVLIYNAQVSDEMTRKMLAIAKASGVAIVSVTETEPHGVNYQTWMSEQLDALDAALAKQAPHAHRGSSSGAAAQ
ncbi:metal ABC transporter solute-binding protein, Zn/Mn family [Pararobbsia silviterrae]|uniref:Cation ABC transporter substrate-binding protein n=1 Tax=Pararobbsia silviterrae TaxID=1792498 RepID=A0A494Y9I2_9BURK|nr:zinc ABC transporter substrate-binding protein [Pararobbsia silviterrae]RKP59016.1 cation ABC transporter substrate-binding protein [Pararobbsia silviterrae]